MGIQLWRSYGPTFCWKQGLRLVYQQPCQAESWIFPVRQIAPLVWQPVSSVQLLRNTFCAGVSVSRVGAAGWALGVECSRREAMKCQSFAEQRAQGPVAQPGVWVLREHSRSWWLQTLVRLYCEIIKPRVSFVERPCSEAHGLSCFFDIAPWLKYFKHSDNWNSAMEKPCLNAWVWGV